MKIAILCSSYSRALDDYARRSIDRTAANLRRHGHDCDGWEPYGYLYVDAARNNMVEGALANGADAVLFHDGDQMLYAPESVDLAALFDIGPVVGAAYVSRQEPPYYVLTVADGGQVRRVDAAEMSTRTAPFPCYWIGTGALWIRASVFQTIPFPWFASGYRADGRYLGEDVTFCEQCRTAGIPVLCQPAIVTGHLATVALVHRPGCVGGGVPAGAGGREETFRIVSGDAVVVHRQEALNATRVGRDH